jgi:hypothetical protein
MAEIRDITYINRDFADLKNTLIDYAKTYFPNTYNDFTPSSTGMLFMEMAAYVGDVLSFYLDNQIQETFIQYARQKENLFSLAYMLGYRPKVTTAASVNLDFYQTVPAISVGSSQIPDYNYSLQVLENTSVSTTGVGATNFLIQDKIDFSYSSSLDPTEISVYTIAGNQPTSFLLKKTRKAISATINSTTFSFGSPQRFSTIEINTPNIIGILDVVDSDGNKWYEVPNLAQDLIYDTIRNTNPNDPNYSLDTDVPYLLQVKSIQRRFVTRFLNDNTLQIQFGSGTVNNVDEEIIPNPNNVGLGLPFEQNKLTTAFSPLNFIFTDSYGIAPSNTTLTVRYLTGGGLESNVAANTLNVLDTSRISFINPNISNTGDIANTTFNSIAVTNPVAASGGKDGDTVEELRLNSLGTFQNQLRTVTKDDYLIRALSMPPELGAISKAFASPETIQELTLGELPTVMTLYVLGYDINKHLTVASTALKQNLKTYLSQYRMINDSVKIKDAFIVNIGINFDIITYPNFNNNEVILKCIDALTDYFAIDKWQINEPIIMKDLFILLDKVEGVQTVKNIEIVNKTGSSLGYSDYGYDIPAATLNGVVYPSIDPMIFELKYTQQDLQGRIVTL